MAVRIGQKAFDRRPRVKNRVNFETHLNKGS